MIAANHMTESKKLGFIVNPLAGIGGKVGLKGSDGEEIVKKALSLGAEPEANIKAAKTLERLKRIRDRLILITCPGPMGEDVARSMGFEPEIIGGHIDRITTPGDTEEAARKMLELGVDMIIFAGGDGTARNVYNSVGNRVPVVGIPAGVKIHSAVYADTPAHAGDAALMFLSGNTGVQLKEAEVMDIDEDAFRNDMVSARLYGYMMIPNIRNLMQSAKAGSISSEKEIMSSIASDIMSQMCRDVCYIIGPGTTMRAVMEALGLRKTLLGVDAVLNGHLIGSDLNESGLLHLLDELEERQIGAKIVVTVIGGQGYVFGRGNQQISHRILRRIGKENVIIAATESKMIALNGKPLLVDTGDAEVNKAMSGYVKVITSLNRRMAYPITY